MNKPANTNVRMKIVSSKEYALSRVLCPLDDDCHSSLCLLTCKVFNAYYWEGCFSMQRLGGEVDVMF